MQSFYLPYENSRIHGAIAGKGEDLLICLHGFGESTLPFSRLVPTLGKIFTIVAIDLPLHGKTEWKENRRFEREDLHAIITLLLETQKKSVFSLLGYSMGGRVALCLTEMMGSQMRELILLAADGLRDNPWHQFVTQTSIGHRLFKHITYHPKFYFWLLNTGNKLKLINNSLHRFANNSMNTLQKRELVLNVWTIMAHMMPNRQLIKQQLAQYRIHTLLIFGKYDRVIPSSLGIRFMDGTFPAEMMVLDKGHQLLTEDLGEIILDKI
ncbi:alpha/beta fold hydrolase [Chitinophaga sancti]|uniref:alpha/beta fold hydrolase n=1 Tax=Chitinophaga sancti TaxID=1004 RepID=UPI003F7935B5